MHWCARSNTHNTSCPSQEDASVYCTGRSVRGKPSSINRPETIEKTAEMVTARGQSRRLRGST